MNEIGFQILLQLAFEHYFEHMTTVTTGLYEKYSV